MDSPQNILVCVTQQVTCKRLILKATEYKNNEQDELHVIHVAKNEWNFLDNIREGEALEYLFKISKSVGANLSVLKSDDIVQTIVNFVEEHKITHIVMGKSPNDHKENNFYTELKGLLDDVKIHIIPQNGN
ncbi:MAG: universal stress protein UspA [Clostridium sp.]|mgnify:CR=1 FL=1|nr:universal stress protein UspA [Clostridium sp.]